MVDPIEKRLRQKIAETSQKYFPTFIKAGAAAGRGVKNTLSYDLTPGIKTTLGYGGAAAAAAYGLGKRAVRSTFSGGWLAIWLFVGLWVLDIKFFSFNGLNIQSFWNRIIGFGPSDYWGIFFSSGVLVVLVAIGFLKIRSHQDMRLYLSYAFVVWFYALILSFTAWDGRAVLHLLFGILFYFVLLRPNIPEENANITLLVLLFFDFFFFSFLSTVPIGALGVIGGNHILYPIWVFYALYMQNRYAPTFMSKAAIFLIIGFFIFANYQEFKTVGNFVQPTTRQEIISAQQVVVRFWENLKAFRDDVTNAFNDTVHGRLTYATTGDYYTGQVDSNAKEPLGVRIEDVRAQQLVFRDGEPVSVYGKLTAQTIDAPTHIQLSCEADSNSPRQKQVGTALPDYFEGSPVNLIVEKKDQESIGCSFDSLELGSHMITIAADFSFTTLSYLPVYFIQRGNPLVDPQGSPKDSTLLRDAGFLGVNPDATYTPGPVAIGIGTLEDQPIKIGSQDKEFVLGVTLSNNWDGSLDLLNDIVLSLPDGIEVKPSCTDFEPYDNLDIEDGFALHLAAREREKRSLRRSTQPYITYSCPLFIPQRNAGQLLNQNSYENPYAIKNFKATATYSYHLEKSIPISVQAPSGFYVQLSPAKPASDQAISCIGKGEGLATAYYTFSKIAGGSEQPIQGEKSVGCSDTECRADLQASFTQKGDIIRCTMRATTKEGEEESDLKEATVGNSKPQVESVAFSPEQVTAGSTFSCVAAVKDPDSDSVSATYRFDGINELADIGGCEQQGDGAYRCEKQLTLTAQAGDTVTCSVTPWDGEENGDSKSTMLTVRASAIASSGQGDEVAVAAS